MPSRSLRGPTTRRQTWALGLGATLLGTAVATELRKPRASRTWEGRIAGFLPYDLRVPTAARCRFRLWNASDRRILVPQVFGVGWTVNFGRLLMPWVAELPVYDTHPDQREDG